MSKTLALLSWLGWPKWVSAERLCGVAPRHESSILALFGSMLGFWQCLFVITSGSRASAPANLHYARPVVVYRAIVGAGISASGECPRQLLDLGFGREDAVDIMVISLATGTRCLEEGAGCMKLEAFILQDVLSSLRSCPTSFVFSPAPFIKSSMPLFPLSALIVLNICARGVRA
jgi:hypothetical protein